MTVVDIARPIEPIFRVPQHLADDPKVVTLYERGIVPDPKAFPRHRIRATADDVRAWHQKAERAGVNSKRGPNREYWMVPPEMLRDFTGLLRHQLPFAKRVLGPGAQCVEVAVDAPLPRPEFGPAGETADQPPHRDCPFGPVCVTEDGEFTFLAYNLALTNVTRYHGPLRFWPGSHQLHGDDYVEGMFLPPGLGERLNADPSTYAESFPMEGDGSWRTPLMNHCGTRATRPRLVMVFGWVASPDIPSDGLKLELTDSYHEQLPPDVRDHLRITRITDTVEPYGEDRPQFEALMGTPQQLREYTARKEQRTT